MTKPRGGRNLTSGRYLVRRQELAALPPMIFLRLEHSDVLPGVLMIADGP